MASTDARVSGRVVLAASVGNVVEWYDWTIYATFAVFFSGQFFPEADQTAALLATLGIFAVGFFMRPLGGWLIGTFSDRRGRRAGLTLTIVMMAGAALLIAVLPPYSAIGIAAPILLTVARLVQGLSVGGEFGSGSTYLAEAAPAARRGFVSSFYYVSLGVGLLVASGLGTLLTSTLSEADMRAWGWRVPFFVGALGALAGLWIRRSVAETPVFEENRQRGAPVRRPLVAVLTRHPGAAARIVGFTLLATLAFYTFASYLPTYAVRATGITESTAFQAHTLAIVIFLLLQPLYGMLSDRFGRRPQLLVFSIGYALVTVPLMSSLTGAFWSVLVVGVVGLGLFGLYSAIAPAVNAEQFPTEIRAVGVGSMYNLTVAIFGGTAPYLLTWLSARGLDQVFFWYVVGAAVLSTVVFATMPESGGRSLAVDPARRLR